MGHIYNAWAAFKTQVSGDTALNVLVKTFKYNRDEQAFQKKDFGVLIAFPTSIPDESFITVPRGKIVDLIISVGGKVANENGDSREDDIIKLDEAIKNAIEKDLTLGNKATIVNMGASSFNMLGDIYAETSFQVRISSLRFLVGAR